MTKQGNAFLAFCGLAGLSLNSGGGQINSLRNSFISRVVGNTLVGISLFPLVAFAAPRGVDPDPIDVVYGAEFVDGKMRNFTKETIQPKKTVDNTPKESKADAVLSASLSPQEKLHTKLKEMIATKPGHEFAEVVVGFQDDVKLPRFAQFDHDAPMDTPANQESRRYNESAIEAVKRARGAEYKRIRQMISGDFGGDVTEEFWITKAVVAKLPLSSLTTLSARPGIQSITPNAGIGGPAGITVADGRSRINSDRWYNTIINNGLWYGRVAYIDSGIRSSHTLFRSVQLTAWDCVGSTRCQGSNGTTDLNNHGTSVAGIIAGNSDLGLGTRGVTPFGVDSY